MSSAPDTAEFLLVGRVRKAHGIRGELVVELLTDAPGAVYAPGRRLFAGTADGRLDPRGQPLVVKQASPFKGGLIVHFDGITDRTQAELWRERYILAPASEVPPPADDEVYLHDLIGMRMTFANGDVLGDVVGYYELPQGVVLEVKREKGETVLIPFSEQVVDEVDANARLIRVTPPEGLLE